MLRKIYLPQVTDWTLDFFCCHDLWSWSPRSFNWSQSFVWSRSQAVILIYDLDLELHWSWKQDHMCNTHLYFMSNFWGTKSPCRAPNLSKVSYRSIIGQIVIMFPNFTNKCSAYSPNNALQNDLELDLIGDLDHYVKFWSFGLLI